MFYITLKYCLSKCIFLTFHNTKINATSLTIMIMKFKKHKIINLLVTLCERSQRGAKHSTSTFTLKHYNSNSLICIFSHFLIFPYANIVWNKLKKTKKKKTRNNKTKKNAKFACGACNFKTTKPHCKNQNVIWSA